MKSVQTLIIWVLILAGVAIYGAIIWLAANFIMKFWYEAS